MDGFYWYFVIFHGAQGIPRFGSILSPDDIPALVESCQRGPLAVADPAADGQNGPNCWNCLFFHGVN
jgi:hypothetical protein